jgi:hypothetical protein
MTTSDALPRVAWGIDAEWAFAQHVPHSPPVFWPYVTGTPDVKWSDADIAAVHAGLVIRVDQGFGTATNFNADEFDIEARALSVFQAGEIAAGRAQHSIVTRFYGGWDTYAKVSAELASMGLLRNVWWRIADWDLNEQMATAALVNNVYAVQWASPTSNPRTLIPGTDVTLKTANADLSVALTAPLTWRTA